MTRAKILSISRLRMGTDGRGITTLVGFHGCPLNCKYCLNPKCHSDKNYSLYTALDIFKIIKKDRLYFLATNGGITFGGGEPLLNSSFIMEVLKYGANEWHTTIETSLNVPFFKWKKLVNNIDEYIVDIKDINNEIYEAYTEYSNDLVIQNLKYLKDNKMENKVLIRIPIIKGYNTQNDICLSKEKLLHMGFSRFNVFEYKVISKNGR